LNPPSFKIDTFNPTFAYECELEFLQKNEFRNNTIKTIAQGLKRNALILVDRIAHGEVLLEYLKTVQDKEVHFICGAVDIEERERVRSLMESSDNVLCIAISKIFSTGINIKNLHYIIFASIGKARIKIIQSIGRSLRLHANKKQAVIFDIGDNLRYGTSHLEERLSLYESESIPYNIKNIKQTP
jgi:superfamily II DNA or RNA helicase